MLKSAILASHAVTMLREIHRSFRTRKAQVRVNASRRSSVSSAKYKNGRIRAASEVVSRRRTKFLSDNEVSVELAIDVVLEPATLLLL